MPVFGYTPQKSYFGELQFEESGRGRGTKVTKCLALSDMDFWSPGHSVDSCTDSDNTRSICDIKLG